MNRTGRCKKDRPRNLWASYYGKGDLTSRGWGVYPACGNLVKDRNRFRSVIVMAANWTVARQDGRQTARQLIATLCVLGFCGFHSFLLSFI